MTYSVFIVEDEAKIRKGLVSLLEDIIGGFKVTGEASNGREGLELLRSEVPDLLITDIRMPVMNGIEMISHIRGEFPYIDILILSGYDDFEYAKQGIRYQVNDYLLKPVNRIELAGVLDVLKGRWSAQRRPSDSLGTGEQADRRMIIRRVKEIVKKRLNENVTLQDISEQVYLSAPYLSSLFKAETGQNFVDYVAEERIKKAKQLLKETNLKIKEVSALCGYTYDKYFMSVFKQHVGVTPTEYRDLEC